MSLHILSSPFAILPYPQIDPVALNLGPIPIHWYGLAYVVGILAGWWLARRLVRADRLWPGGISPISETDLDDFIVWAAVGIVVGGRLGYVLFYDLDAVLADPLLAVKAWKGGMSFHGGLTGVIVAIVLFSLKRPLRTFSLFDVIACVAPIGLFFGRIANFINGELWGRPSDLPWAMVFPTGGPFSRHPSQLYEAALEGLLLLAIVQVLAWSGGLRRPGLIGGVFIAGYGLARIFVEFFREPDGQLGFLYFGWVTRGMELSAPMVLIGLWAIARALLARRSPPQPPTV